MVRYQEPPHAAVRGHWCGQYRTCGGKAGSAVLVARRAARKYSRSRQAQFSP